MKTKEKKERHSPITSMTCERCEITWKTKDISDYCPNCLSSKGTIAHLKSEKCALFMTCKECTLKSCELWKK